MNNDVNRREHPLEWSGEQLRQAAELVTERLARFLDSLPEQRVNDVEGAESLAREVLTPWPEAPRDFVDCIEFLFDRVFPRALNTTSPGYLAYVPGGGLPSAALADWIALTTNRYSGLWRAAPLAAAIETTVIRWFCDLVGFGNTAGGYLATGGSMANWSALVVAREQFLTGEIRRGVLYTSDQTHHSVVKAAVLLGIPRSQVRGIRTDTRGRMNVDVLRETLKADRQAGLQPFAIVGNAGTTNTGAIDPLPELADLAAAEGVWFHVDAAYGGFFLLTDRGRTALRGIERADSVTLDPHKGLFLPYGTGCLVVRDRSTLQRTFGLRGEYLTMTATLDEFPDFCDLSPELSREFRGLRVWLPVQCHGIAAFRQALDEKLDLAAELAARLRTYPELTVCDSSGLSIVPFHSSHAELAVANERTAALLQRVNAPGRVLLSSTTIQGRLILRACILSFRTHRDRVRECGDLIEQSLIREEKRG